MANVYISEYGIINRDSKGMPVQIAQEPSAAEQLIAGSASSQQSAAFGGFTNMVRIHSDGVVSLAFGSNPTAVITAKRMAAGTEYFGVAPGMKVAVINNT